MCRSAGEWMAWGAVVLLAGCDGRVSGPPTYPVAGTVAVDGEPLAEGAITFDPADGKGGVYGGPIRQGRFAVRSSPGRKRVGILGMKMQGVIGPDGKPMATQFLPPRYNLRSELTADVEPAGTELSFALTLEPKPGAGGRGGPPTEKQRK